MTGRVSDVAVGFPSRGFGGDDVEIYLSDGGFSEKHQLHAAAGLGSVGVRHGCV